MNPKKRNAVKAAVLAITGMLLTNDAVAGNAEGANPEGACDQLQEENWQLQQSVELLESEVEYEQDRARHYENELIDLKEQLRYLIS